jgi:hypothetical protein
VAAAQSDRRAIDAMGEELAGSGRPFVIASGTAGFPQGRVATEESTPDSGFRSPRSATEAAVLALSARGVRVSAVRLPPTVHGEGDHGFVPRLIDAPD